MMAIWVMAVWITMMTMVVIGDTLHRPLVMLPSGEQAAIACRWSPVAYTRRNPTAASPYGDCTYRMILAVATLTTVLLYDTEQLYPIAYITKIHYSSLTDLAWYDAIPP
jgi:chromatin assembly factor 1 subunit B